MTGFKSWSVCIIAIGFVYVLTDDSEIEQDSYNIDSDKRKKEYQHVFRSIPTVFEYLIQMLEEKPEILEKNDAATFQLSDDRKRRSAGEFHDEKKDNGVFDDVNNEEMTDKQRLNLLEYTNIPVDEDMTVKGNVSKKETSRYDNIKFVGEKTSRHIESETDQFKNEDKMKGLDKINNMSEWNDNFEGFDSNFFLTPEEVAEQVLKVEKMLDDYNKT